MITLQEVQLDTCFVKFAESKQLVIGSLHENGYLFHLTTGEVTHMNWFYGNPVCAILDHQDQWAAMGGHDKLSIWNAGALQYITNHHVYALRQTGVFTLQFLTDPWDDDAAIWELDLVAMQKHKITAFPDYSGKPYTEEVTW